MIMHCICIGQFKITLSNINGQINSDNDEDCLELNK